MNPNFISLEANQGGATVTINEEQIISENLTPRSGLRRGRNASNRAVFFGAPGVSYQLSFEAYVTEEQAQSILVMTDVLENQLAAKNPAEPPYLIVGYRIDRIGQQAATRPTIGGTISVPGGVAYFPEFRMLPADPGSLQVIKPRDEPLAYPRIVSAILDEEFV